MCESLTRVDRVAGLTYDRLHDNYLSRDTPVIVVDAMDTWPVMNTDDFYFDNITQVSCKGAHVFKCEPCKLFNSIISCNHPACLRITFLSLEIRPRSFYRR